MDKPLAEDVRGLFHGGGKMKLEQGSAEDFMMGTLTVGQRKIKVNWRGMVDDPNEVDRVVNETAELFKDEIEKMRRGVVGDEHLRNEVRRMLADEGFSEADVLSQPKALRGLAERVMATNFILGKHAEAFGGWAKAVVSQGPLTPEALQDAMKRTRVLGSLAASRSASVSEIGRALRASGIAPPGSLEVAKRMHDLQKTMAGLLDDPQAMMTYLRAIGQFDNIQKSKMFIAQTFLDRSGRSLMELWINALLSNPATHVANFGGNTFAMLNGIGERYIAGGIGSIWRGLTGKTAGVYASEGNAMIMAGVSGFGDALRVAGKTAVTGVPMGGLSKLDHTPAFRAISAASWEATGILGKGIDVVGFGIGLPTRGLMTMDDFFKSLNRGMALEAEAARVATAKGLSGEAKRLEMARLMTDPDFFQAASKRATDYGYYAAFQNDLGVLAGTWQDLVNKHPILRALTPFTRTPANLISYGWDRIPGLGLIGRNFTDIFKSGDPVKIQLALAKQASGAMMFSLFYYLGATGVINGEEIHDRRLKEIGREAGFKPNSINFGGGYQLNFNRADPLGMMMSLSANFSQIMGDLDEHTGRTIAWAMASAFGEMLANKTYLQGVGNLYDAISSGLEHKDSSMALKFAQRQLGSLVPAVLAQVNTAYVDPVKRDLGKGPDIRPEDDDVTAALKGLQFLLDGVKARVPGWSKTLKPHVNLWGEEVHKWGSVWNPYELSRMNREDTVSWALIENGVKIQPVRTTLFGPAQGEIEFDPTKHPDFNVYGTDLTPEQHYEYAVLRGKGIKLGGKTLHEALTREVERLEERRYSPGPQGTFAMMVKNVVSRYDLAARLELMKKYPELRAEWQKNLRKRVDLLRPSPGK